MDLIGPDVVGELADMDQADFGRSVVDEILERARAQALETDEVDLICEYERGDLHPDGSPRDLWTVLGERKLYAEATAQLLLLRQQGHPGRRPVKSTGMRQLGGVA